MDRRTVIGAIGTLVIMPASTLLADAAEARAVMEPLKMQALMGGDFATATSELALKRGSSSAVTQFAKLEIAEQAATALAFGARPGMAGVTQRQAAMIEQLQGLRGAAFDRAYIIGQIQGHDELLAIHRRYARAGRDPMARGASTVGVTGIQTHLVMLNSIARMV